MGLDQYAYSAARAGQQAEYWENTTVPVGGVLGRDEVSTVARPKDLAYWRKHPNLQGWMEQLWISKGSPNQDSRYPEFNGVELELTWEDLDDLERDVLEGQLPSTSGFFFGDSSDSYYRDHDLQFIREAKADLLCGMRVFYNSSW